MHRLRPLGLCLLGLVVTSPALGQPRPPAPRPPAQRPGTARPPAPANVPGEGVPQVSSDPPQGWDMTRREAVLEQIRQASLGNSTVGSRLIAQALLSGVEPDVAAAGLDTLGALGRAEGSAAILAFLEHRRATLRRHAVVAAQALGTRTMARALELRLADPDAAVRGDAANALAEIGDARTTPALWAAMDRDLTATLQAQSPLTHGCALGLARRGTPADIERLLTYIRRAPFVSIAEALSAALARRDVTDDLKLRIVRSVADVSTPEVQAFLNRLVEGHRGRPLAYIEYARTAAGRIQ